jgi:hypothetical protein
MSTENENTIGKQLKEYKKEITIDKSTNISILKDGNRFFRVILYLPICIEVIEVYFPMCFLDGSCTFVNCSRKEDPL